MNHRLRQPERRDLRQALPREPGQSAQEIAVVLAVGAAILIAAMIGYTYWTHRDSAPKTPATRAAAQASATPAPLQTLASTASASPQASKATTVPAPTPVATKAIAPAGATASGSSPRVQLAPFEGFPGPLLARLRTYFQDAYGITVTALPALPVPANAVDTSRQQLIAERLLDVLAPYGRNLHPGVVTIGLTQRDMMIADTPQWQFGFSLRSRGEGIGVISTARMDPVNLGLPGDDELLFHRALKMIAKNLGVLYYGLSTSNDPTSVMFGNVLSLDDLDRMGERIPIP